jgi:amidase
MSDIRPEELAGLDATAQAALVARGEVSAAELVNAAIARIEDVNPKINAIITPMFDEARRAAAAALPNGPFRGVPYLLKDLMATYAGVRQTWGSAFLARFVPRVDSELVVRLKAAGLVVVGKTNTPEFGILPTTEPTAFGACRNPWNPDHSVGGSSGGSAAAVAARLVPAAHANDGGGSIRIPASSCGVFGLKPTRGRNPVGPEYGEALAGFVAEHALTISVRDSAALLDATAGPDVGDPYWAPPPERPYRDEVGRDPGRLRLAFATRSPTDAPVHEDCAAAVRDVAALCASLGHDVEEFSPEIDPTGLNDCFIQIYAVAHAAELDSFARILGRRPEPGEVEPLTLALHAVGAGIRAPDYVLAQQRLQQVSREIGRSILPYDAWITPTIPEPPPTLGQFEPAPDDPLAGLLRASYLAPFTAIGNFTGMPAMSMPLFWNRSGLPIGVQLLGRFGDEGTLFRLAAQLESARPWKDRRPPICAA